MSTMRIMVTWPRRMRRCTAPTGRWQVYPAIDFHPCKGLLVRIGSGDCDDEADVGEMRMGKIVRLEARVRHRTLQVQTLKKSALASNLYFSRAGFSMGSICTGALYAAAATLTILLFRRERDSPSGLLFSFWGRLEFVKDSWSVLCLSTGGWMTATKMLQFSKETILQISEELMSYKSNTQPIY